MSLIYTITTTTKKDGAVLSTWTESIIADGCPVWSVGVLGGVSNQQAQIPINIANLQGLLIGSSQPVTIKVNGNNAVQSLTITGSPTGGTFTVTYATITSGAIAYNASAATVQTALQAMSSIGANNVTVTGSDGGPWTLTFSGALGVQPITTVTRTASFTGGTTPDVTPASVTTGVVPVQTLIFSAGNPLVWSYQDGFFADPLSVSVVNLWITNPGTVAAKVTIELPSNS
jgi:hypothetical protein